MRLRGSQMKQQNSARLTFRLMILRMSTINTKTPVKVQGTLAGLCVRDDEKLLCDYKLTQSPNILRVL